VALAILLTMDIAEGRARCCEKLRRVLAQPYTGRPSARQRGDSARERVEKKRDETAE
jgi:hypothetical protein